MELLMSLLIGLMFTAGVYLILSKNVLRIIIGTAIVSHGANLTLLTIGGIKRGNAPILLDGVTLFNDPIPQALILTAIVIGFAVTALFLVVAYRAYQENGTDMVNRTRGNDDDDD